MSPCVNSAVSFGAPTFLRKFYYKLITKKLCKWWDWKTFLSHLLQVGVPRVRRAAEKDSVPQGSIKLPSTLTENLTAEQQQLVSRVQFNFYQKSTLFQVLFNNCSFHTNMILQLVNSGTVITMVSFFFLLPYRTNRWKTKYWTVASLEPVLLMCQSLDCKMIL